MKSKKPAADKKQNPTLRDLKVKKDPRGGFQYNTLPSIKTTLATVSVADPTLRKL